MPRTRTNTANLKPAEISSLGISESSAQFHQDMKFAMFSSFGLQKHYYMKDGKSEKMAGLVLRPCAAGGLFFPKPSRALVQQGVIKLHRTIFSKLLLKSQKYFPFIHWRLHYQLFLTFGAHINVQVIVCLQSVWAHLPLLYAIQLQKDMLPFLPALSMEWNIITTRGSNRTKVFQTVGHLLQYHYKTSIWPSWRECL